MTYRPAPGTRRPNRRPSGTVRRRSPQNPRAKCPECYKRGVTIRDNRGPDDVWVCRYCDWSAYAHGSEDETKRAALADENPDGAGLGRLTVVDLACGWCGSCDDVERVDGDVLCRMCRGDLCER